MDDDQLDFLRIEALKSASKKKSPNTSTSGHKEDEEEDDDEEKSLRELALKSCQKDGINKPESDNTINQNVNKEQNDFQISNKSAVEELHLREKALKSLLKMRVVKTETIIKVLRLIDCVKKSISHSFLMYTFSVSLVFQKLL